MVTEEYTLPFLVIRVCPAVMAATTDAKLGKTFFLNPSSLSPFPALSTLSVNFCYDNYCPTSGATPTLLKLKAMRGADGKPFKIIQTIAAGDYMTFGMYLLQDDNGVEVELIEKNNKDKGAEGVTQSILQKWLTNGTAPTRTYQHLIESLGQSELGALADLIASTTIVKGY